MAVFIERLGTLPRLLAGLRMGCGALMLLAGLSQWRQTSPLMASLLSASPLGIDPAGGARLLAALGLGQSVIGTLLVLGLRTRLCGALFTLWSFAIFFLLLGGQCLVAVPQIGYVWVPIPTAFALQALLVLVPAGVLLTFSRSAGLCWGLDCRRARRTLPTAMRLDRPTPVRPAP